MYPKTIEFLRIPSPYTWTAWIRCQGLGFSLERGVDRRSFCMLPPPGSVNFDDGILASTLSTLSCCCFCAPGLAVGLDPEGYGNPDFCWLSIYDTLIWSFAGPVAFAVSVSA